MATTVDFGNLKSEAGLAKLNAHMIKASYVSGYAPTQQDVAVLSKLLGLPDNGKYPHAARWARHVSSFSENTRKTWAGQKVATKPAVEENDDDFDPFAEETPEEAAAAAERKQEAAAAKKTDGGKKKVIAKSSLVIDVKPSGLEVDLGALEAEVRKIAMDGLEWSQVVKRLPIAYGLMKLQIGATIIDEKINTDEILEKIECIGLSAEKAAEKVKRRDAGEDDDEEEEEVEGLVMSAEIVSFNKL